MSHKNQEIESLRAIAVILTMAAHLYMLFPWCGDQYQMWGRAGHYIVLWSGVDLFFCISGYVISKSFVESLDASRATGGHWRVIKAFWVRRAYRLLPSAWFWILFIVVASFLLNNSGSFGHHGAVFVSSLMALTDTMNLGISFRMPISPGMVVYWSLSLEEQFYFAFPFFLLLTPVHWRWRILLIAIAIQFPLSRIGILGAVRLDAMMWGILIYLFSRTNEYQIFNPVSLRHRGSAVAVTVALVAAVILIPGALARFPFHIGMLEIVCGALVLIASFEKGYTLPIPGLHRVLGWIGSRSYAIYLAHLPAYLVTREIWYRLTVEHGLPAPDGTYTLRYAITALVLTSVFAECGYRMLEVPFRKQGSHAARSIVAEPVH